MDLLQTVRKEGSRGGVNFSWDDVKSSQHRENYLGHSLMAPVGRWQQNKDLNWYAKADDAELTPEERAAKEAERKREELRKVKEAEEDAMARALGLPMPDRTNANNEPLGESKVSQTEVNKALKRALADDDEDADLAVGLGDKEKERRRAIRKGGGRIRGLELRTESDGISTDTVIVNARDRGRRTGAIAWGVETGVIDQGAETSTVSTTDGEATMIGRAAEARIGSRREVVRGHPMMRGDDIEMVDEEGHKAEEVSRSRSPNEER